MTILSPTDLARLIEKQERKRQPLRPERLTQIPTAADLLGIHLQEAGLHYQREFQFHPTRKWRADYAVRRRSGPPLLVEVDGSGTGGHPGAHRSMKGYENDRRRDAEALRLGYVVLRVTPRQVRTMEAIHSIQELTESEA